MEGNEYQREMKKVYAVQSLNGFSNGLYFPFMTIFAVERGLTYSELGWFRSIGNVMPNLLQPLFGGLSDKLGKRKYFAAIGFSLSVIVLPFFIVLQTPLEIILLYGLQALFISMAFPTWNSLISLIIPEEKRGEELGKLGSIASLWSLISTIVAGVLMTLITFGGSTEEYILPFYLAAVSGILASIIVLFIREPATDTKSTHFPPILRIMSRKGYFRDFLIISAIFSFSMSMAWPYFAVILVNFQHASKLAISIHSAINVIPMILFQSHFGKLSDRIGRKPLLLYSRLILPGIPLLYVFAPNMFIIYIASFIGGISMAMGFNAAFAYMYDVSPPEERGAYIAVYNFVTGIAFFLGSLMGGYLGDYFSVLFGLVGAVFAVMFISSALRLISAVLYFKLKEPKLYNSTFRREIGAFIKRIQRLIQR